MKVLFLFCSLFVFLFTQEVVAKDSYSFTSIVKNIPELENVPFADAQGIIINTELLSIPEIPYAFNPSIVKDGKEYLMAFRYDNIENVSPLVRKSYLAAIRLNANLQPHSPITFFNLENTLSSEDPRLFSFKKKIFMTYSWFYDGGRMVLHKVKTKPSIRLSPRIPLLFNPQPVEKNWTPFTYTSSKKKSGIYFVYSFNPFHIIHLKNPDTGVISHPFSLPIPLENREKKKKNIFWESKWGSIFGGTPAIRIGNEYITFFHSSFTSIDKKWYVLGAITFDAKPPFKIKRISPYPLLFDKMYETPIAPNSYFYKKDNLRVIFSSGLIEGKRRGKKVFHVFCGENDSAIRIITIDQKKLLKSLIKLKKSG
jgi:predicted GH43/DUF377 family glycosyl hydrolase